MIKPLLPIVCISLSCAFSTHIHGQQSSYTIEVKYLREPSQTYNEQEIKGLPVHNVRVKEQNDQEATYAGVTLYDLLELSPAPVGESLRGAGLGLGVVVEATDGYRVLFSLPELDPAFNKKMVLLAYSRNDQPLDQHLGPLRLVIPAEQRHARWVRKVSKIYVLDATELIKQQPQPQAR